MKDIIQQFKSLFINRERKEKELAEIARKEQKEKEERETVNLKVDLVNKEKQESENPKPVPVFSQKEENKSSKKQRRQELYSRELDRRAKEKKLEEKARLARREQEIFQNINHEPIDSDALVMSSEIAKAKELYKNRDYVASQRLFAKYIDYPSIDGESLFCLGSMYFHGDGTTKDMNHALLLGSS